MRSQDDIGDIPWRSAIGVDPGGEPFITQALDAPVHLMECPDGSISTTGQPLEYRLAPSAKSHEA
ncbi:hypothetical protein BH18CHL1_BH18CHL1_04760 [soil metagenome]